MAEAPHYIVVSPVKDEQAAIEHTLESMIAQTVKPREWIVVDDGSTDSSAAIVRRYASRHSFIRLISNDRGAPRQPGSAVVRAFNRGLQSVQSTDYDFIVKLDGDLTLPSDYFERIFDRFATDDRLGIASGIYLERDRGGAWRPVSMPWYHTFGASKVVRRQCFEQIGGFVASIGWDTVDEIKAMSLGWKTVHFPELQALHHKPEGSGIGVLRTSRMHGEIYYVSGGDPWLFVLKVIRRLWQRPRPLNALSLLVGYIGAVARGEPKLVTTGEMRLYRGLLRQRLLPTRTPFSIATKSAQSSGH